MSTTSRVVEGPPCLKSKESLKLALTGCKALAHPTAFARGKVNFTVWGTRKRKIFCKVCMAPTSVSVF